MKSVNASIITIGDELLIGQTVDTNSAWMAQELNRIGIWVHRRIAVGDVKEDIRKALDDESKLSEIILITGGLGPTADDITKPLLCEYFGGKLVLNEDVLKHIEYLFEQVYRRPGPLLPANIKQAEVPDNCIVLHNARGTAPGMWFETPSEKFNGGEKSIEDSSDNTDDEKNIDTSKSGPGAMVASPFGGSRKGAVFVSLPGVPFEMKGLMKKEVLPRLQKKFDLPFILHRTIFTSGIGESMLADTIKDFESSLPAHIKLAYLPGYGMVRLRLTGKSETREPLEKELDTLASTLKEQTKEWLVTDEDISLPEVIGKILKSKNKTLGTAESCTGGYIAHLITSVPGSSAYFNGTVVSYSNRVKENILGVAHETLETAGAVSEDTVQQMVKGAIEKLDADFALATSGIMGPDGGTEEKPVGTVWIAVGNKDKVEAKKIFVRFDRERNIQQTAHVALDLLRRFILANS